MITLALQPSGGGERHGISCEALRLARGKTPHWHFKGKIIFAEADLFPPGDDIFATALSPISHIASDEIPLAAARGLADPLVALSTAGRTLPRRSPAASSKCRGGAPGPEMARVLHWDRHQQAAASPLAGSARGYREIAVQKDYQNVERFVWASAPEPHPRRGRIVATPLLKRAIYPLRLKSYG